MIGRLIGVGERSLLRFFRGQHRRWIGHRRRWQRLVLRRNRFFRHHRHFGSALGQIVGPSVIVAEVISFRVLINRSCAHSARQRRAAHIAKLSRAASSPAPPATAAAFG